MAKKMVETLEENVKETKEEKTTEKKTPAKKAAAKKTTKKEEIKEEVKEETENSDADVVDEEKKEDFEDICFLSRSPDSKVGKMLHLPNNIHICQNCMQKVFDSMGKGGMNLPLEKHSGYH